MRNTFLLVSLSAAALSNAQLGPEHRFVYPATYPSPLENALAIHDMDGDGDGDLIFNTGGRLWLNEQVASGTYSVTSDLGAVSAARHFRTGDIDGDGIEDIVFLEETPNRIAYVPILGGGAYGPVTDLVTTVPGMIDLQLGDLDGDLDMDLVATREGAPLETFWCANDGNGAFGAPIVLFTDLSTNQALGNTFALADLDADTDLDLAVPVRSTNSIHVLRNEGGGLFTDLPVGSCEQPMEIVAATLDGDPSIDLAVSAYDGSDYALFSIMGNGDGTFSSPVQVWQLSDHYLHRLAPADADGDGDNDLIFEFGYFDISNGPVIMVLYNDGSGGFPDQDNLNWSISDSGKPYALGDLNGNSIPDLASTANDGLLVALDGSTIGSRLNSLAQPKHIAVGQFTGSAIPDVVLSGDLYFGPTMEGRRPLQMALHASNNGVVSEAPADGWQPASGSGLAGSYPADLDNDGDDDLLALWQDPWMGSFRRWCVFMNNSGSLDSTYAVGDGYSLMQADGTVPHLGDLDNDGDLDLVWRGMDQEETGITTCESNGDGSFGTANSVFVGTMAHPRAIGLCDVDQDGTSDYVWTMQDSLIWAVYDGNGSPMNYQYIGMAPFQADIISTVDLDGNGSDDLVMLSADSVAFLFNDGNNGFINGESFTYDGWSLQWPFNLNHELGDIDGNGFPDLVAIGAVGDIFYYPNFGNGDIGWPLMLITGTEHTGRNDIALADMDGDGDLDVLTCSETGAAAWLGNDGMLPTALPSSSADASLVLYPNPMSKVARVIFSEAITTDTRVELVDVNGRVLRTINGKGTREVCIERGSLSPGLYVVRVVNDRESVSSLRLVVE